MTLRTFLIKAQSLDRRWIFLMIALSVVAPFAVKIELRGPVSPHVEATYAGIEALAPNSQVLLSLDFDPPSEPELLPTAIAWARHLALRGHRIYFMSLWPLGQQETNNVMAVIREEFPELVYGENWVELGYRAGGQGVIQNMLSDISRSYSTDAYSRALSDIPMMAGVSSLRDFDMILSVSSGDPGAKQWVQFAGDPGNIPVAAALTAVSAPQLLPYYPEQMFGLVGGMKASADYEWLLFEAFPERFEVSSFSAIPRMVSQTVAHIVIMLFILFGNVAFFLTRGKGSSSRLKSLQ
jgi:hypothetical protein